MLERLQKVKGMKMFFSMLLMGAMIIISPSKIAHASDVKSSGYALYYNSKESCNKSEVCKITYYAGTNYFKCSSISGNASVIYVEGTGYNVNIKKDLVATRATKISFVPTLKSDAKDKRNTIITVSMDFRGGDTAYASGKIYFN